jgi:hypothetical protein
VRLAGRIDTLRRETLVEERRETAMLSKTLQKAINEQIKNEFSSA